MKKIITAKQVEELQLIRDAANALNERAAKLEADMEDRFKATSYEYDNTSGRAVFESLENIIGDLTDVRYSTGEAAKTLSTAYDDACIAWRRTL